MTTIMGLDLSLTASGLATWRDAAFYLHTIVTDASMAPPSLRHDHIARRILAMRDPTGATLAVVEGRIKPSDDDAVMTALDLAELRGAVYHALWSHRIPIVEVHPSTLKVIGTGRGDATKADMLFHARAFLGAVMNIQNHNEADAAWLLAAALQRYSRGIVLLPPLQQAAVNRCTWPTWFEVESLRAEVDQI